MNKNQLVTLGGIFWLCLIVIIGFWLYLNPVSYSPVHTNSRYFATGAKKISSKDNDAISNQKNQSKQVNNNSKRIENYNNKNKILRLVSFSEFQEAEKFALEVETRFGYKAKIKKFLNKEPIYAVSIGPFTEYVDLKNLQKQLDSKLFIKSEIILM